MMLFNSFDLTSFPLYKSFDIVPPLVCDVLCAKKVLICFYEAKTYAFAKVFNVLS